MFDARAAKLLAPGAHLTIDGCPGLRLEATASTRSWTYRFKSPVDGRMRQCRIGQWPAMSLPAAMGEWDRLRALREAGQDPALARREQRAATPRRKLASRYTVRQVVADYVDGHIKVNRKTKGATEVERMFRTMLDGITQIDAASLTRAQAFDLIESWRHVPVQAAKLRSELGAAWDYALDAGRLPESTPNWWRTILRGKLRSKGKQIAGEVVGTGKRVLSDAEAGELINWLPNFSRLVDDVCVLYLWTCARGSEIVSMEAEEVAEEPDGLWWTIPKIKTKNARHPNATDLRVPLIGRAEQVVRRRLAQAARGYLFPQEGEDARHTQQKTIQTAVWYHQPYATTRPEVERPRLTVTRWAPHDLRRTGRTMLAALGCPREVGEAIIGHMPPGVVGTYDLHTYDRERRIWLTRLADHLERLAVDGQRSRGRVAAKRAG